MAFVEIMTSKYCPSKCEYCARDVFLQAYGDRQENMTLEDFNIVLDKIPSGSIISFAGFGEPLSNPSCIEMILAAHSRGFQMHFLTTCVGMTIEKYERIKRIPFLSFSIHIPDENGKTSFPITEHYKETLRYIMRNSCSGLLYNHHSGSVHPDLREVVPTSILLPIHDRAGNVKTKDDIIRVNKITISRCQHVFLHTYLDGAGIILPNLEVTMCCMDMSLDNIIGDLRTESWEEIHKRSTPRDICKKCTFGV